MVEIIYQLPTARAAESSDYRMAKGPVPDTYAHGVRSHSVHDTVIYIKAKLYIILEC